MVDHLQCVFGGQVQWLMERICQIHTRTIYGCILIMEPRSMKMIPMALRGMDIPFGVLEINISS